MYIMYVSNFKFASNLQIVTCDNLQTVQIILHLWEHQIFKSEFRISPRGTIKQ